MLKDRKSIMTCLHCNNTTSLEVLGKYQYSKFQNEESDQIIVKSRQYSNRSTFTTKYYAMLKCVTCSMPTIAEIQQIIMIRSIKNNSPLEREEKAVEDILDEQVKIIFPLVSLIATPKPAKDMPQEIINDYNEARAIFNNSPRASAALLRLTIQKLCKYLGEAGKNINEDIAALVKKGLPPKIQQSLDIVRVIGNNAVHPGEMDLQDDKGTVMILFKLVNFIIEEMITRPKEIEEIYNILPESARKGIEKRDQVRGTTI